MLRHETEKKSVSQTVFRDRIPCGNGDNPVLDFRGEGRIKKKHASRFDRSSNGVNFVFFPRLAIEGSVNLKPANVAFAEDLPAAGRCKAARAQTYDDTSSPCQRRPASRRDKIGAPGG